MRILRTWHSSCHFGQDRTIISVLCSAVYQIPGLYGGIVCNKAALMDESCAPSELSGQFYFTFSSKSKISLPPHTHDHSNVWLKISAFPSMKSQVNQRKTYRPTSELIRCRKQTLCFNSRILFSSNFRSSKGKYFKI